MTTFTITFPFPPEVLLLAVVALVNFVLAWRIWIGNSTHPNNIFFALAVFMAGWWSLWLVGLWGSSTPSSISLYLRLAFFSATLIPFFFYLFTHFFPYKTTRLSPLAFAALLIATAFILFISLAPNVLLPSEISPQWRFTYPHNFLWHLVFTLYLIALVSLSFRNLVTKYKRADGIWRLRLRQVIIATSVAFVGGALFNLILPIVLRNNWYGWIGPVFTVFMAGYIWYHVFWKTHRKARE